MCKLYSEYSFDMQLCKCIDDGVFIRHGPVGRVFTNGLGDLGSIRGRIIQNNLKMLLDTSLLNTQNYKVRIKGKVEQSRETSSVVYWPPTRPNKPFQRRRKCIFRWPVMGRYWVGAEQKYDSVHRKFREFGGSEELEKWWENSTQQRARPPGPRLSSPGERERNADGHKSGGQYVAVLFPLTHNPFK